MEDDRVTLIVFAAPGGGSRPERVVAGAKAAAALDLVELGLGCPLVDRVIVACGSNEVADRLPREARVVLDADRPGTPFHFGQRLREVVERYESRRPLYFGGGSAPLLAPESLEELCGTLLAAERAVITNSAWSADFFGFYPADAVARVDLPGDQDNSVPYLLSRQAGLTLETLEPAIENSFDVDTPADVAILRLQSLLGTHLRSYVDSLEVDTSTLERVLPLLVDVRAQITMIGRVSTGIWGQPGSDIPGHKRLYVEERGMKAFGREARGEVRSLIGGLLETVGPERLFGMLADFSDAIFFDTRVVFHHLKLRLSNRDRFASDMGLVDEIRDPAARAFTAAARECVVPVVLGGQNVVGGALWALTQEAWNRSDAGLLATH